MNYFLLYGGVFCICLALLLLIFRPGKKSRRSRSGYTGYDPITVGHTTALCSSDSSFDSGCSSCD